MSGFDVLERYGTAALLRFLGLALAFALLHLARMPVVLTARALEVAMQRIDTHLTAGVSAASTGRRHPHQPSTRPPRRAREPGRSP
ncbi:hypothetical protein SAMN06265360_12634 [Haloechinothrix alba]|uniref:Uncharacterized protein n=1 Tax=Haloechinothrix alba TaxID=664784 RepID=A0A238ZX11_9PSEU|nr:hypothetical protein [Haloechinothrix alba]SNR87428.1 hypothetical protein SAMN06265360_12634 [Haloechinothrix alba]